MIKRRRRRGEEEEEGEKRRRRERGGGGSRPHAFLLTLVPSPHSLPFSSHTFLLITHLPSLPPPPPSHPPFLTKLHFLPPPLFPPLSSSLLSTSPLLTYFLSLHHPHQLLSLSSPIPSPPFLSPYFTHFPYLTYLMSHLLTPTPPLSLFTSSLLMNTHLKLPSSPFLSSSNSLFLSHRPPPPPRSLKFN